jgi:hypothetical protein
LKRVVRDEDDPGLDVGIALAHQANVDNRLAASTLHLVLQEDVIPCIRSSYKPDRLMSMARIVA